MKNKTFITLATGALLCTSAHAYIDVNVVETTKCTATQINRNQCAYIDTTVTAWTTASFEYGKTLATCFGNNTAQSDYCYISYLSICTSHNDSGYDGYRYCSGICSAKGYNILIYEYNANTMKASWACACQDDHNFVEWRPIRTGSAYLRRYKKTLGSNCEIIAEALDQYKCAPGYWGPNNNLSNCKACPANATCPGGTSFSCNSGYYVNGSVCTKCPNSKEGGLGWDINGNGVNAIGGDELEYCAIAPGTTLRDNTGTFRIDENESSDGCEYTP